MKKYLVIINPEAGKGRGLKILKQVEKVLKELQIDFIIKYTKEKFDAQRNLKEWLSEDFTDLVVIGGDGTLNEIVNGMYPLNYPVRFISTGTGNDFIKSINLLSLKELFTTEKFSNLNLFSINEKIGVNAIGIGFDGKVIEEMDRKKLKLKGLFAYMVFVLLKLFTYKPPKVKIKIDKEEVLKDKFYITCISNGKAVGGGFFLTPDAKPDDDKLDICLIKHVPFYLKPYYLLKVLLKKHKDDRRVIMQRIDEIIIETKEELKGQIDGQFVKGKRFYIKVLKDKLRLVAHHPHIK
ncbi:MAG: YegS/Rv2252/BmrU family lipid kinase [bacterium]|nr:YegS/Rv2252/BmrU family lipid kinase [bacterium]